MHKKIQIIISIFSALFFNASLAFCASNSDRFLKNSNFPEIYTNYSSGIVYWENSPRWRYANKGVAADQPLVDFKTDIDALRHEGMVGVFLPDHFILFPNSQNPRLEFLGRYEKGNTKSQINDPATLQWDFILIENPPGSAPAIVTGLPLFNSFTHKMSLKRYESLYRADYEIGGGWTLTPYLGGQYMSMRNLYYLFFDDVAGVLEINETVSSSWWGPKIGLEIDSGEWAGFSLFVDGNVSLLRSTARLSSYQSVPALELLLSPTETQSEISLNSELSVGVKKRIKAITFTAEAGFEQWSYVPEVVNPLYVSDKNVHLEDNHVLNWFWSISAEIRW